MSAGCFHTAGPHQQPKRSCTSDALWPKRAGGTCWRLCAGCGPACGSPCQWSRQTAHTCGGLPAVTAMRSLVCCRSTVSSSDNSQPSHTSKSPGCCCCTVRPPGQCTCCAMPSLLRLTTAPLSGALRPCSCRALRMQRYRSWGPGVPQRRGARLCSPLCLMGGFPTRHRSPRCRFWCRAPRPSRLACLPRAGPPRRASRASRCAKHGRTGLPGPTFCRPVAGAATGC